MLLTAEQRAYTDLFQRERATHRTGGHIELRGDNTGREIVDLDAQRELDMIGLLDHHIALVGPRVALNLYAQCLGELSNGLTFYEALHRLWLRLLLFFLLTLRVVAILALHFGDELGLEVVVEAFVQVDAAQR